MLESAIIQTVDWSKRLVAEMKGKTLSFQDGDSKESSGMWKGLEDILAGLGERADGAPEVSDAISYLEGHRFDDDTEEDSVPADSEPGRREQLDDMQSFLERRQREAEGL